MNEEAAFLAAIRADPGDDTRRLAFADWLDEHGRHLRATMIRDHIAAYHQLFEESVICGGGTFQMQSDGESDPLLHRMQRVAAFTADLGSNGLNPFLQSLAAEGRLAWCRGFVDYVEVSYDELIDHAAEIFWEHPVTRVDLVAREPYETLTGKFCWLRANDTEELYDLLAMLPGELFDPLTGHEDDPAGPDSKLFRTRLLAMDALSVVCVEIGRAEAQCRAGA